MSFDLVTNYTYVIAAAMMSFASIELITNRPTQFIAPDATRFFLSRWVGRCELGTPQTRYKFCFLYSFSAITFCGELKLRITYCVCFPGGGGLAQSLTQAPPPPKKVKLDVFVYFCRRRGRYSL